jgi:hypothetical protein
MPRYFFQADYHGATIIDDVGEEFPTLQDARAHAVVVAKELGQHNAKAVVVSVLNENMVIIASAKE